MENVPVRSRLRSAALHLQHYQAACACGMQDINWTRSFAFYRPTVQSAVCRTVTRDKRGHGKYTGSQNADLTSTDPVAEVDLDLLTSEFISQTSECDAYCIIRNISNDFKLFFIIFCFRVKSPRRRDRIDRKTTAQSCPWVGLTRGLGWVGLGMGRKCLFLVGWVGSWV